jgi:hypothetical protein
MLYEKIYIRNNKTDIQKKRKEKKVNALWGRSIPLLSWRQYKWLPSVVPFDGLDPYFPQGPKVRLIVWVICFWHKPPSEIIRLISKKKGKKKRLMQPITV